MKVIIPMSGMSSRFAAAGYDIPKYLIEIDGKKVIEHIVDLYPKDSDFVFIINDKHEQETDVVEVLHDLVENPVIVTVPCHKLGPVHSVLKASDYIDDEEQVIVNYCDFSMKWNYDNFKDFVDDTQCDGCVVTYIGFHPHMLGSDNYAFCRLAEGSTRISEIREKQPFTDNKMSEHASTGTYYFKTGRFVKDYFQKLIDEDVNINGEYYVSLVHNLLIQDGLYNTIYEVPHMLQWGTPLDMDMYRQWSNYYRDVVKEQSSLHIENCVKVVPMAGKGSRFQKEGFTIPKPFLTVNDDFMVQKAVDCLPNTSKTIFGCQREHRDYVDFDKVVWFDEVLPGQACSTEQLLSDIDDESFIVTACDNGVLYNSNKFINLVNDKSNDIIVWSYRNNYTAHHNPEMYSWLDVDANQNIQQVFVKEFPFNSKPVNEYAIVGTMFFRNKDVYNESLYRMYELDEVDSQVRTNGEFYIDNLLNVALDLGYKIKNFEVDHYICWGTPNDLQTYRYWQKFFNSVDWHPYDYEKDHFTNPLLGSETY